ncbi:uncharacterized protein LOC142533017 [Primulina tabacum]|uniref:uncharacterized protein LOC142533017 n=1 Tax=Primulina tabacum TaxID=48773 RepID=UPI003F5A620A
MAQSYRTHISSCGAVTSLTHCFPYSQFADFMEVGESVLDTIYDDEGIEDGQDVEMQDVEEGELLEPISKAESGVSCNVEVNQVSNNRNSRRKKKKKKNKQKTDIDIGPNVTDINRFVLNVCKRLRERKSYLMCTAVGCIDVSALSDLVKEVRLCCVVLLYHFISGHLLLMIFILNLQIVLNLTLTV